ncbi:LacI family DNA-binding transcriptional regulator [Roseibacillus persicicus]|uniref:LacI family transcriptional regulator n=1 Tax=Roseibacillus persicicus TaxID=454148 RepID=A0A918TSA8_9BACT|nr:LacI family DNA-binding transcriptional regulator [Roseibacillus persicicus]GHC61187.1 LacI family transcriptional regulator [Roseibacillus persicicus]
MNPSIKDVAKLADCSTATVSRVLAGKGYISESARKKVEEAVKELGYRPNRVARSLRAQKSRVIGLVLSDIRNPFFSEISRAVEQVAFQHGYNVLICNTDEDSTREEHYLKLLEEEQVAGILLSPTRNRVQKLNTVSTVPLVLFDRKFPKSTLDSVIIDNEAAAHALTRTLIAGGFKRIAGIFGARSYTASARISGFKSAFEGQESFIAGTHQIDAFEEEGNRLTKKLLNDDVPPDAILCSSALLATGAFRAIKEMKLRVPEDIGFACFDDPSWATFVDPPVTVIRQPAQAIGESAAELLMKRIEAPDRPVSEITLQGELIQRASTGGN